ncbi:unnamed protein product [Closterium sp. NIES-53]
MASWQLSVLTLCTLALLLAPAAARPNKEEFIYEIKQARDALKDHKLNNKYHATRALLDHVISQLETDWNPTDDFLNKVDHKTVLVLEDRAIASAAPDVLAFMVKRDEVDAYSRLFRANMLDGVYEEADIANASGLKDVNGHGVNKNEMVDAKTRVKKVKIGKAKAKVKVPAIFRGRFLVIHGVDAVQPED